MGARPAVVVRFADGRGEIAGTVESGRVYIDGKGIGDVGEVVLKDRKHLSEDGMVVVIIAINQASGEVIYGPDIVSRGFVFEDESQQYLDETKKIVLDLLAGMNIETLGEWGEVKQEVRRILRRFFNKTIERRPVILPVILEM